MEEKIKELCVQMALNNKEDPHVPIITGYDGYYRRHELWEKYRRDVVQQIKNRHEND